ncbi:MAG: methyltransferase domain-containing protein [Deltaproteobacteria bacterium]|nr:methyltransferase domain-containing protein [Deltaproteobacteria bacterium]
MYFMEDSREAERLAAKVAPESWVTTDLPAANLHRVRDVLDVGCGPGVIVRALANRCPKAQVTGLDISPERVARATWNNADVSNVAICHASAACMPFEDNRFDLVYCRLLLEYLPDRAEAVAEMARVCRPGGSVILQDLDGQLLWHFPCDERMNGGLGRVLRRLSDTGFDPFVGRKLYSLAWRAGLRDLDVRIEPYHLIAGAIDERNYELWKLKLDIAFPFIVKALGSRDEAEQLAAAFLQHLQREDTLTYSVVFTVSGRKEGGKRSNLREFA